MRRAAVIVLIVLLSCGLRSHVPAAHAISYAPGWNLVSGPEGSHLVGASGEIYTLRPGDRDYEIYPADTALSAGFGYWAFFPEGGSLNAGTGNEAYTITLNPGEWTLLGNPSSRVSVNLFGSFTALAYIPGGGYVNVTSIPVGQGVWVLGSGALSLGVPPGTVAPVQPLTVTAFVDPLQTTVSFSAPGVLVIQLDVTRNGLPVKGARVSGSVSVGTTLISTPFGPDVLRDATGEVLRFPSPPFPISTRLLIHVDATLDGITASVDTFYTVHS